METDTAILPPRYRSVQPIARGGMGEIFRATDETLGREVAVKVLAERFAREEPLRARFTREALAAARLSGEPHTVTIYDVGEWGGRPYIVMEHVAGGTVDDRLREGVEPAQALRWLEQAAEALDAAHEHGIVHRDVKPANLLLGSDGAVRVADFGIASAAGLTSVTATGTVLGTLGYLAPEQASGRTAGPAADRYALAVVAYELLAGRRPYQGGSGTAEAAAAVRGDVPRVSQDRPELPRGLDAVFLRALAADPDDRYASCAELVADLRRAFDDDAGATRAGLTPVRAGAAEARRAVVVAAALLALAGAGAVAAVLLDGDGDGEGGGGALATQTGPPQRVTVTARGETVTVTTPASVERPTASAAPAGESGVGLNDRGYRLLQQGDYASALPYFEQAVQRLQGTGSTTEAYADYNLALTRFALGRCDGVLELLDASESIQGERTEIGRLRRVATARC